MEKQNLKIDLTNYQDNLFIQQINFDAINLMGTINKIKNDKTKKDIIESVINFLQSQINQ
jgi:hypothetical protein